MNHIKRVQCADAIWKSLRIIIIIIQYLIIVHLFSASIVSTSHDSPLEWLFCLFWFYFHFVCLIACYLSATAISQTTKANDQTGLIDLIPMRSFDPYAYMIDRNWNKSTFLWLRREIVELLRRELWWPPVIVK